MMLRTVTRSPPSCAAILPQKFSAATTSIFALRPDPLVADPLPDGNLVSQAASRQASTATVTPGVAASDNRRRVFPAGLTFRPLTWTLSNSYGSQRDDVERKRNR